MKKILSRISELENWAAVLLIGAAMAACSGDSTAVDDPTPVQPSEPAMPLKYTMTVQATKSDAGTRALSLDGDNLNATWATTENVYVKKGSTWATGSLQPQAAGTTADLKGELSGITIASGDNLALQFPKSGSISYTGQLGTLSDIAANFDWATANVTVESVKGGQINVSGTTTFQNQQAVLKFTLLDKADGTTTLSPSALTVTDGTNTVELTSIPDASYTTNGAGVLYVAFPAAGSAKTITLTATVGNDTYTYEKSDVTFTNGQYYAITVKMTKQSAAPEGALSGLFSVSATKQVYFSQGNLQAVFASAGSTCTWKFADNQWDYIGGRSYGGSETQTGNNFINGNGSVSAAGTVDLFGWSTSATYYGIHNSDLPSTYSGDFVDWGATMGTGWFTLETNEWVYLFYTRTASTVGGTANGRYAAATVNSVAGVILFPDSYTHPSGVTVPVSVNDAEAEYTVNSYSGADWTAMENAGAVFLPAAGNRGGSSVYYGSRVYYWSSSPYNTNSAYNVYFQSGWLELPNSSTRDYGYSVRLVHE